MAKPSILVIASVLVLGLISPADAQSPPPTQQTTAEPLPAAVMALTDDEGSSRIVVLDPDGTSRVLTDGPRDAAPVAAPDGDRAAFVRLDGEEFATTGELHLIDLDTGAVEPTGIQVDRSIPIHWVQDHLLITSTAAGVVEIRLDLDTVELVPGTTPNQVALDVRLPPQVEGAAPSRPRVLTATWPTDDEPARLLELNGTTTPTRLWSYTVGGYTLPVARYGPEGSIAVLPTISSSGFGTIRRVTFIDPDGNSVEDASYGGDGPVNLFSGPFWRPSGGAVLFGGGDAQRFPGGENATATLLVEGPGSKEDRIVATSPAPAQVLALGWLPDASATIAIADEADADAALVLLGPDGAVQRAVTLPGDLAPPAAVFLGTPDADIIRPIRRVGGEARAATAVKVSQATFPTDRATDGPLAEQVVLARGDAYADALAGAPLARSLDAPLLLTGRDVLDDLTSAEIARLGATEVVVLGGTNAIAPPVVTALEQAAVDVRRIAGDDRFATAAAIAAELPAADRVVLVQGADADPSRGWPDAVSAAPLAAASTTPLLLTRTGDLPDATAEALRDRAPTTITVVGGTSAVSDDVAQAAALATMAGATVQRIAGPSRVATAVAVADAMIAEGAGTADSLWLATSADFPDALAAGPAVAADGGVLLLVPEADPTAPELVDFLQRTQTRVARLVGGPGVIGGPELDFLLLSAGLGGPPAVPLDLG